MEMSVAATSNCGIRMLFHGRGKPILTNYRTFAKRLPSYHRRISIDQPAGCFLVAKQFGAPIYFAAQPAGVITEKGHDQRGEVIRRRRVCAMSRGQIAEDGAHAGDRIGRRSDTASHRLDDGAMPFVRTGRGEEKHVRGAVMIGEIFLLISGPDYRLRDAERARDLFERSSMFAVPDDHHLHVADRPTHTSERIESRF